MSSKEKILKGLTNSFWAKRETIVNYILNSANLDGVDYVTQDSAITLLTDEESHKTLFKGYLKEYSE